MLAVVDTGSGAQLHANAPVDYGGPPRWSPTATGWCGHYRGLQVWNVTDGSAPRSIAVPGGGGDALAVLTVVGPEVSR